MTTTYGPSHPSYFDESDLRQELERVYDLCHGCRLCFNLCPAFPTLFELIDSNDGRVSALTAAEQDRVVGECYQCKLCYIKCPYVPPHEWELDFPRLMMRAQAVGHEKGESLRERVTDQFLGRTDLLGTVASAAAPVVNALTGKTGSLARHVMQATVGIHADRLLPPYARERFTTWFNRREEPGVELPRAEASIFPTCFVEYMEPDIGRDLVSVCEHNGISCSLPAGTKCCGAPWLHNGDVERFAKSARRNVAALATEVHAGRDIVVLQPTCAYIVRKDYPIYASGPDANLVAAHTYDAVEYLMNEHRRDGGGLDTEFVGEVPKTVAYHLACHLRAENVGCKGRDLLALTGTTVTLVEQCAGIDGTWGYRAENYDLAREVAAPLGREMAAVDADVVAGDCHLANTAILQETGDRPLHPVELLARAYGIHDQVDGQARTR